MKAVKKKISIFLMTLMLASTFSANVTKADVIESKYFFAVFLRMKKLCRMLQFARDVEEE